MNRVRYGGTGQNTWRRLAVFGMLAAVALVGAGRAACQAAAPATGLADRQLPALLASATVLSDAAMSQQTAAGLQTPKVGVQSIGRQPMLLWDEMRPRVPVTQTPGGSVTITISGSGS